MTGFGKGFAQLPEKKICAEIKTLNSKSADMATRLPSTFREADLEVRQMLARELMRGKIDLTVTVESIGLENLPQINLEAVKAYHRQVCEMATQMNLPQPEDWYELLLRLPDSFRQVTEPTETATGIKALFDAISIAIAGVNAFRAKEGEKLEAFFRERIERIATLLSQIDPYEQERVAKIKTRLKENLEKIDRLTLDESRLEQELIFYIEKFDVTEEKQRLKAHLQYFLDTLEGAPGQGKKLGFISQEMGREINTLGSKSNHAQMQRIVVMMKDELEQIKEQVLNVL